ncbi:MAG: methyltransferase family protein [Anaerolineae bacterium]
MKADSAHESNAAHKSRWEIGEVVFGIPFLMGIALHVLFPFSLLQGILRQVLISLGVVLIIIGMGFIVLARREFAHFRQPTDPGQPTSKVIKSGVFAISRNPLYLGAAFLFSGVALMMNTFWTLATLLVSMIVCHYVLIVPEEEYLASKFGEAYKAYTATVRRWLGRKRPAKL